MLSSCWRGNIAEFLLSAKFPQKTGEFYCNVKLDEQVKLISLDYTILHNGKELRNFSVEIPQTEESVKQTQYRYAPLLPGYIIQFKPEIEVVSTVMIETIGKLFLPLYCDADHLNGDH